MKKTLYQLDFAARYAGLKITAKDFEPLMARAIKILCGKKHLQAKMFGGMIHLVLVEDQDIALLNAAYQGKDGPTDVISLSYFEDSSFPGAAQMFSGAASQNLVGEIMISADTAKRQAREHKKTLLQELQFLFVHGVLHIFGYDHEKTAERKVMFDLQDEILQTKSWRKIIDEAAK